MTGTFSAPLLIVSPQEAGLKLLRFLERRLLEPPSKNTLHKWIRSGQVRINGSRAKPFSLLDVGDKVRIPPFACPRPVREQNELDATGHSVDTAPLLTPGDILSGPGGGDIVIIDSTRDLLVLSKPDDLPCQPGSGHVDSVSSRLAKTFSKNAFIPAPAHRLDRRTSGLVLGGNSHRGQQLLHNLFRTGGIHKEYLAWVRGDWPHEPPSLLEDRLALHTDEQGKERFFALPGGNTQVIRPNGGSAPVSVPHIREKGRCLCIALPVQRIHIQSVQSSESNFNKARSPDRMSATLLLVLLLTGHKHQIRVQLASRNFPIIGDRRYGIPGFPLMLLHAYALGVPAMPEPMEMPAREYCLMPDWPSPFEPDEVELMASRAKMRAVLDLYQGYLSLGGSPERSLQ